MPPTLGKLLPQNRTSAQSWSHFKSHSTQKQRARPGSPSRAAHSLNPVNFLKPHQNHRHRCSCRPTLREILSFSVKGQAIPHPSSRHLGRFKSSSAIQKTQLYKYKYEIQNQNSNTQKKRCRLAGWRFLKKAANGIGGKWNPPRSAADGHQASLGTRCRWRGTTLQRRWPEGPAVNSGLEAGRSGEGTVRVWATF